MTEILLQPGRYLAARTSRERLDPVASLHEECRLPPSEHIAFRLVEVIDDRAIHEVGERQWVDVAVENAKNVLPLLVERANVNGREVLALR